MGSVHVFQCQDVASTHAAAAYCATGLTATLYRKLNRSMAVGGTPGATARSTIDTGAPSLTEVFFVIESDARGFSTTAWPAGQWTLSLFIDTGNANYTITKVSICRLNSSGASQETIASSTMSVSCATAGPLAPMVLTQAAAITASATDRIMVVIGGSVGGSGTQTVKWETYASLVSPIPLDVAVDPAAIAVPVAVPAATIGLTLEAAPAAISVPISTPTPDVAGTWANPAAIAVPITLPAPTVSHSLEVVPEAIEVSVSLPLAVQAGPNNPGAGAPSFQAIRARTLESDSVRAAASHAQALRARATELEAIHSPLARASQALRAHTAESEAI